MDDNDVTPPPSVTDDDLPTCTVQLTPPPLQPLRDALFIVVAVLCAIWDALRYWLHTAFYDPLSEEALFCAAAGLPGPEPPEKPRTITEQLLRAQMEIDCRLLNASLAATQAPAEYHTLGLPRAAISLPDLGCDPEAVGDYPPLSVEQIEELSAASSPDAWETYQQWAAGKMNDCEDMQLLPWQLQQVNMAMGLAGEAGETVEIVKKAIFHGHELDRDRLTKELGDVLFYLVSLATAAGIPFQSVVQGNVNKLDARYPAGFSSADSLTRRDSD